MSPADRALDLRPAGLADLDAIMALEQACFSQNWSERSWAEQVRDHFVVVAGSGQIIGVAAMRVLVDAGEVLRIMVRPGSQRRGIGRALLGHALTWAASQGVVEAFLEVSASNQAAIGLYEASGFRRIDRRSDYYGPGDDALVYRSEEMRCLGR